MMFELEEPERQLILLGLAQLALDRPGWNWTLGELSEKLSGREMFENLKLWNADRFPLVRIDGTDRATEDLGDRLEVAAAPVRGERDRLVELAIAHKHLNGPWSREHAVAWGVDALRTLITVSPDVAAALAAYDRRAEEGQR